MEAAAVTDNVPSTMYHGVLAQVGPAGSRAQSDSCPRCWSCCGRGAEAFCKRIAVLRAGHRSIKGWIGRAVDTAALLAVTVSVGLVVAVMVSVPFSTTPPLLPGDQSQLQ